MTRLVILALAASALVPTAAIASRDNAEVRYEDLDLSKPSGMKTLERRIAFAARQVCRTEAETGTRIFDARKERECKADVAAQVKERLTARGMRIASN